MAHCSGLLRASRSTVREKVSFLLRPCHLPYPIDLGGSCAMCSFFCPTMCAREARKCSLIPKIRGKNGFAQGNFSKNCVRATQEFSVCAPRPETREGGGGGQVDLIRTLTSTSWRSNFFSQRMLPFGEALSCELS